MKKILFVLIVLAVVFIVAACNYNVFQGFEPSGTEVAASDPTAGTEMAKDALDSGDTGEARDVGLTVVETVLPTNTISATEISSAVATIVSAISSGSTDLIGAQDTLSDAASEIESVASSTNFDEMGEASRTAVGESAVVVVNSISRDHDLDVSNLIDGISTLASGSSTTDSGSMEPEPLGGPMPLGVAGGTSGSATDVLPHVVNMITAVASSCPTYGELNLMIALLNLADAALPGDHPWKNSINLQIGFLEMMRGMILIFDGNRDGIIQPWAGDEIWEYTDDVTEHATDIENIQPRVYITYDDSGFTDTSEAQLLIDDISDFFSRLQTAADNAEEGTLLYQLRDVVSDLPDVTTHVEAVAEASKLKDLVDVLFPDSGT